MTAIWEGNLGFALVNIPSALYSKEEVKDLLAALQESIREIGKHRAAA